MSALQPCSPPRWAPGGHAQTILGSYLPVPPMRPPSARHRIPLPDGDQLTAAYYSRGTSGVLLSLFHGLSGHNDAVYMRLAIAAGLARGYDVLAVNHRGCGDGAGLALGPYHSGRADDIAEALRFAKGLKPGGFHAAVGFSLSGNALLLAAAGERGWEPFDLAVSVNAPIRLEKAAVALKRGLSKLYDLRFSVRCREAVRQREAAGLADGYHVPRFCSLHDFDNAYTAPAGGFTNREDYYHRCSAARFVSRIKVPTVVLTSKNDPMVDYRDYLNASFSDKATLHIEEQGGHLGYLDRRRGRWLPYFLDHVFASRIPAHRALAAVR